MRWGFGFISYSLRLGLWSAMANTYWPYSFSFESETRAYAPRLASHLLCSLETLWSGLPALGPESWQLQMCAVTPGLHTCFLHLSIFSLSWLVRNGPIFFCHWRTHSYNKTKLPVAVSKALYTTFPSCSSLPAERQKKGHHILQTVCANAPVCTLAPTVSHANYKKCHLLQYTSICSQFLIITNITRAFIY